MPKIEHIPQSPPLSPSSSRSRSPSLPSRAPSAISKIISIANQSLNHIIPPTSRQQFYTKISNYAQTRPLVFSFLLTHLTLSALPIMAFLTFTICTAALALTSALLFILFWSGLALLLLLIPTLFLAFGVGCVVWAWMAGWYIIARALYRRLPALADETVVVSGGGKGWEESKGKKEVQAGFDGTFNE